MEFFKANPTIPFMKQRWFAAAISLVIVICSILSLCVNGLNLGSDFTGGTQAEISFAQPPDLINRLCKRMHKKQEAARKICIPFALVYINHYRRMI